MFIWKYATNNLCFYESIMIISILNQKGGVGKTTLSIHIASALALGGKKVLLIDADAQRSALDWSSAREQEPILTVVGMPSNTIHKQIKLIKEDYDFIVIDGPPRIYDVAKSCIAASDLVLIPVQPSPYDVWSANEVVKLIQEVKEPLSSYKEIKAAFIINRVITKTVIGRDVKEALDQYDIPVIEPSIHQRVSYAETASQGTSAIEEDPNSLAGQEIKKLTESIVRFARGKGV